jgi:phosphohistidine phosphatase SixA
MTLSLLLLCAAAQAVAPPAAATTVILVRHAEKADGTQDPALSPEGAARAAALAKAVAEVKLGAVIVSDTRRARDTAALAAAEHGLAPIAVPVSGGGEAHVKGVVEAVRGATPGSVVLVVGHSNTLAPIIGALGGPEVGTLCEKQFATMYTLALVPGAAPTLVTTSYGAPDPPGASDCKPQGRAQRGSRSARPPSLGSSAPGHPPAMAPTTR